MLPLRLRLLHVNAALREAARPRQCRPSRVSQSMAVKGSYRLSIVYVGYPAKRGRQRSRRAPCLRCPRDLAKADGVPLSSDTSATLRVKRGSERATYFPNGIEGYVPR